MGAGDTVTLAVNRGRTEDFTEKPCLKQTHRGNMSEPGKTREYAKCRSWDKTREYVGAKARLGNM